MYLGGEDMSQLYTLEEAAEKLSLAKRTLYNWVYEGKIKAVKVGGALRITEEEIKSMVKPFEIKKNRRD